MARASLPPGFRFHPTDVELVMYYLKRKVLGKKHFKAIAEVNIYKFSPWDLPVKSCLKSKDLEWFFFCPREKKYASGVRVKRATENGYWKTTGKDRPIIYDNRKVGTVKTLVFHLGHAPTGERTDWVIHEYKILDDQLATAGVQDTYVLCKVFKKDGLGPKNGAQYGAPFEESDWADDDDDAQNNELSFPFDKVLDMVSAPPEMQCSIVTGMVDPGSTSLLSLNEAGPSSTAGHSTNEVLRNESGDDIYRLLASFTDDYALPLKDNGNHEDDIIGNCFDGNGIYNGLDDLEHWAFMNEGIFGSGMQNDGYPLNGMLPEDNLSYIELDDLLAPLNCSPEDGGTEHLTVDDIFGSYNHGNMAQGPFASMVHHEPCASQLPTLPQQSKREDGCSDALQMVDNRVCKGYNTSNGLDLIDRQRVNGEHFPRDIEREI